MSLSSAFAFEDVSSLDSHFASTVTTSNALLEQQQSLPSLNSLNFSLDFLAACFAPDSSTSTTTAIPRREGRRGSYERQLMLPTLVASRQANGRSQDGDLGAVSTGMERRRSWADARSSRREYEQEREALESGQSSDEEAPRIDSFPPRRPYSPHFHRRVRSDPGPSTASSPSKSSGNRDLRRSLLKRRATLTHRQRISPFTPPVGSLPPCPSPIPPPTRPRRSVDNTAQGLRLKTFNFPSTASSPFLLSTPQRPSSSIPNRPTLSILTSSASSVVSSSASMNSRFSDSSDEESDTDPSSSEDEQDHEDDDEVEDGENEDQEGGRWKRRNGHKNAFDLELHLFPSPPSPSASSPQ